MYCALTLGGGGFFVADGGRRGNEPGMVAVLRKPATAKPVDRGRQ